MLLQHCKLVMAKAGGCPCQAIPRAIVELSDNISNAMPHLNRVIKGCAYNQEKDILSFHMEGKSVVVYAHKIVINKAEDETEARRLVGWLRDIINVTDEG